MTVAVIKKAANTDIGKMVWVTGTLAEVSAELDTSAAVGAGYEYNASCRNAHGTGTTTAYIFYYERP